MHPVRRQRQVVEQRPPGLGLVAVRVAGGKEPLVAPPDIDPGPVDRVSGGQLADRPVDRGGDPPTGEHHGRLAPFRLRVDDPYDQAGRDRLGEQLGVGVHDDAGLGHATPAGACLAAAGSFQTCTRCGERFVNPVTPVAAPSASA